MSRAFWELCTVNTCEICTVTKGGGWPGADWGVWGVSARNEGLSSIPVESLQLQVDERCVPKLGLNVAEGIRSAM